MPRFANVVVLAFLALATVEATDQKHLRLRSVPKATSVAEESFNPLQAVQGAGVYDGPEVPTVDFSGEADDVMEDIDAEKGTPIAENANLTANATVAMTVTAAPSHPKAKGVYNYVTGHKYAASLMQVQIKDVDDADADQEEDASESAADSEDESAEADDAQEDESDDSAGEEESVDSEEVEADRESAGDTEEESADSDDADAEEEQESSSDSEEESDAQEEDAQEEESAGDSEEESTDSDDAQEEDESTGDSEEDSEEEDAQEEESSE